MASTSALHKHKPPQAPDSPADQLLLLGLNSRIDERVEKALAERLADGSAYLESERLCSMDEARRVLGGVTKQTMYNWTSQGILNPQKVGGRFFYKQRDLLTLLNPQTTQQ